MVSLGKLSSFTLISTELPLIFPAGSGLIWQEAEAVLFSASTYCQNGPLLEEEIKGSSIEIDVNELSLPSETT